MTPDSSSSSVDDPLFESGHRIFANKDLLKIGHVPEADRIVGRDEEISKLAKRLNGAVHGYSPENVMIYGKTGTGKSRFKTRLPASSKCRSGWRRDWNSVYRLC